ncbi:MAG: hypothetical protein J5639_01365 [Bacteroidales bacterium]|nr:hypothetical protein [Bacteroidales bacterium]MBR5702662.1 hypothetical protein [Bacteroidales bacterium]
MDKKDLLQKYLEAETSVAEERELAKADKNVGLLTEALAAEFAPPRDAAGEFAPLSDAASEVAPLSDASEEFDPLRDAAGEFAPLPDASEEFDRIVRSARRRTIRRWSYAATGMAAILVAVLFLTRKPADPQPAVQDTMEMIRQLQLISNLDPADAEGYEFEPVGDGFIMTARYEDGSTASFLLTPMDGGQSFHLVAVGR